MKCEICDMPLPKDYEYSVCKDCAEILRKAKNESEVRV